MEGGERGGNRQTVRRANEGIGAPRKEQVVYGASCGCTVTLGNWSRGILAAARPSEKKPHETLPKEKKVKIPLPQGLSGVVETAT